MALRSITCPDCGRKMTLGWDEADKKYIGVCEPCHHACKLDKKPEFPKIQ